MQAEIEIVKTVDGGTVYDEVLPMGQCPDCGGDVADGWGFCPSCGAELGEGCSPFRSCENMAADKGMFLCSSCGRLYVPVQVMNEGAAEWNCCPGCCSIIV